MQLRLVLALAVLPLLPALPATAQTEPPGAAATTLAAAHLASLVDMPMFLRLYRARLPQGRQVPYEGSSTMLYDLAGEATIADEKVEGDLHRETRHLAEGEGLFIAAGEAVTIAATGPRPLDLVLILLTARPNQRRALLPRPAVVGELFRTPDPLPGLQQGPYQFTLSRVTLPRHGAAGSPYSRSGAALDYVLAGAAALTADGKTETVASGMPLFERFGWVHRLVNPGAEPLVLLQANVSQEGASAVQPVAEGGVH